MISSSTILSIVGMLGTHTVVNARIHIQLVRVTTYWFKKIKLMPNEYPKIM